MSYRVRYTRAARDDLLRLFSFLLGRDPQAAILARVTFGKSIVALQEFPFSCRKAAPNNPLLHEMAVPFGSTGYVVCDTPSARR